MISQRDAITIEVDDCNANRYDIIYSPSFRRFCTRSFLIIFQRPDYDFLIRRRLIYDDSWSRRLSAPTVYFAR